ncbi:MAG: hypothetical protein U0518_03610 [Candidatus Gracilibacteria bacterium]
MKIFLSHRYTGEDIPSLTIALRTITDTLESLGHIVFCSLWLIPYFEEQHMTADDNYAYCLKAMQGSDLMIAYIQSETESKGMILELERAQEMGLPIVLVIKQGLGHERFRSVAREVVEFECVEEIGRSVREIVWGQ